MYNSCMNVDAEEFIHMAPFRWIEGWEVVEFTPNSRAYMHKDGKFHAGAWGFEKRYHIQDGVNIYVR